MTAARDASLDIAKAIAIVAIVFGHVWRGLFVAGLIVDRDLYAAIDTAVYSWHLTVFAFTAGLFVQRGMTRHGAWRYARDRDVTFAWLYLLWSVIQGVVKLAAALVVNTPVAATDVLRIWIPDGQLWFFGWIALMMVLAAATQPWRSARRSVIVVTLCGIGSIALWGWQGPYLGTQGLALTGYFIVGVWLRGDRLVDTLRMAPMGLLAVAAAVGLAVLGWNAQHHAGTVPTDGFDDRTATSVALGVVVSTVALVAVLALSRLLSRTQLSSALAVLGERSLVIFVAHIVFSSGTRIVLAHAGLDDLAIQVVAGTSIGVAGPLGLYWLAQKGKVPWLFDAPGWLRRSGRVLRRHE